MSNPALFNYAILALFLCATVRWAIDGNWMQTLYWFAAFWLNVAVTVGMK